MQIRGSEAEVSTVPGGEGFGMAGLGKLRGRRGEDFKPDFKARRCAAIYHRCAHITYETTSDVVGLVEREEFLATTGRCNGRWNRRQLEMTQDACDHRLLGDGGNDPQ
jgi:hypothetical protein